MEEMKKREWLAAIRKEKKMNQHDLAKAVGISKSYVSEIEQGNRNPSLQLAYNISKTLDFKMERFCENEKELVNS